MIFNISLNDYFIALLTVVVTLNGIAIPLSYNIISENLKPYLDKSISNIFLNEKAFQDNVIVSIFGLPFLCFPLIVNINQLFKVESGTDTIATVFLNFYILLSFFYGSGFLICFIKFSKMIYSYASNTEEVIFDKIKFNINQYLKNEVNEDTSDFYSTIDKLFKLITVSFEKEQIKNAEKYINYYFEIVVRFYQKNPQVYTGFIKTKSASITSNANFESAESTTMLEFPQRTIEVFIGDFFTDRISKLLYSNIKSNGFENFYFIISRLKDSVRLLMKDEKAQHRVAILLQQFKFINDQIYSKQTNLSIYEKTWFLSETYNWFIELYGVANSIQNIAVLESEILQILKYIIDNKQYDIFRNFLLGMSNSTLTYSFENEQNINDYKPAEIQMAYRFDGIIEKYEQRAKEFQSAHSFEKLYEDSKSNIRQDLIELNITTDKLQNFDNNFFFLLLNDFKENYISIILIKAITYALFKKEYFFFEIYLNYNQPSDSTAFWANKNYAITGIDEIFEILVKGEEIILRDNFFWIGRHGFNRYLNTFLGFYLIQLDKAAIIARMNTMGDYNKMQALKFKFLDIRNQNDLLEINFFNNEQNKESIDGKLDALIEVADERLKLLDHNIVFAANIDTEITKNFKSLFLNFFYKSCVLRNLFNQYNLVKSTTISTEKRIAGVNQLLDKKAFIKQSDVLYYNMPEVLAISLANSENLFIVSDIEKRSSRITVKLNDLEAFLATQKVTFDIILSKGRNNIKSDFKNLKFVEAWAIPDSINKNPNYVGILDDQFSIFLIRSLANEGYVLLNSKKLGHLLQDESLLFDSGEPLDIFTFSLVDFKSDEESLSKHLNETTSEEILLQKVWLRIFEKFDIDFNQDFNGLIVEVVG
jgi:hypothetical protein